MNIEKSDKMRKFGLVGRNISYSFSRNYFSKKFENEGISGTYENFDLQDLSEFPKIITNTNDLEGLNVTIPYKEEILPYLDEIDSEAAKIGAVNTIKIEKSGRLTGFNTDHFGFREALKPHLQPHHKKALILGTGGASKAAAYALNSLNIAFKLVSRQPSAEMLTYEQLNDAILNEYSLLINCTPLGTFPTTEAYPKIPFEHLSSKHLVFDLIYNPPLTKLMALAKKRGAAVINGQKMLEFQAEKAWEIWNQH